MNKDRYMDLKTGQMGMRWEGDIIYHFLFLFLTVRLYSLCTPPPGPFIVLTKNKTKTQNTTPSSSEMIFWAVACHFLPPCPAPFLLTLSPLPLPPFISAPIPGLLV